MAKTAIYGHLAIGLSATNMGKWGIPEKSHKCTSTVLLLAHCDTLLANFIPKNQFLHICVNLLLFC